MSSTKQLRALAKAQAGKLVSVPLAPKGNGSLIARKVSTGVRFYYQYKFDGKLARIPFGTFDERGDLTGKADAADYTYNGAINRAYALAELANEHGDLAGHLKERQIENAQAIQNSKATREMDAVEASRYSLAKLCIAYSGHLEAEGKASAATVRNALKRWVINQHPALANTKAAEITPDDAIVILTAIVDAGHRTTVNRVRSYLRAAYSFGIGSDVNPLLASKAKGFRLKTNPFAATVRVAAFESTSDRVLNDDELAGLLRALQASDKPAARCAELSLRLGAQRITPMLAAKPSDIDDAKSILTLWDKKGLRSKPRAHALPIDEIEQRLIDAIKMQHKRIAGAFGGLTLSAVSKLVATISDADGGEHYTWRDVRRTAETRMRELEVSKDICGQIQSHGLSGVQAKHYDRYEYIPQKKAALKAWNGLLDKLLSGEAQPDNVVSLSR